MDSYDVLTAGRSEILQLQARRKQPRCQHRKKGATADCVITCLYAVCTPGQQEAGHHIPNASCANEYINAWKAIPHRTCSSG